MYHSRAASVFLLAGALGLTACGGGDADTAPVDNTAVSPLDTSEVPSMVTGTTGAPGPGTAGTPGSPAATVPDTID